MTTLEEVERELHQFVWDSMHCVSLKIRRNEMAEDVDPDDEISRLIVEKVMDRFFVRDCNGVRGIDSVIS